MQQGSSEPRAGRVDADTSRPTAFARHQQSAQYGTRVELESGSCSLLPCIPFLSEKRTYEPFRTGGHVGHIMNLALSTFRCKSVLTPRLAVLDAREDYPTQPRPPRDSAPEYCWMVS